MNRGRFVFSHNVWIYRRCLISFEQSPPLLNQGYSVAMLRNIPRSPYTTMNQDPYGYQSQKVHSSRTKDVSRFEGRYYRIISSVKLECKWSPRRTVLCARCSYTKAIVLCKMPVGLLGVGTAPYWYVWLGKKTIKRYNQISMHPALDLGWMEFCGG